MLVALLDSVSDQDRPIRDQSGKCHSALTLSNIHFNNSHANSTKDYNQTDSFVFTKVLIYESVIYPCYFMEI